MRIYEMPSHLDPKNISIPIQRYIMENQVNEYLIASKLGGKLN